MNAEVPLGLKYLLLAFSVVLVGSLGYLVYFENISTTYDDSSMVIIKHNSPLSPDRELNSVN